MASWTAIDTFEADSIANLNEQGGGTGWSAAWSGDEGATVVASPTFSGSRAVHVRSTIGGTDIMRALTTGIDSGIARVYLYAGIVPILAQGFGFYFQESGAIKFGAEWGAGTVPSGTLGIAGSTGVTVIASPSAATWYACDIEFDGPNDRARMSVNGGAFSSYVTAIGGSFGTINSVRIANGDVTMIDNGYHIDDIGPGASTAATPNNLILLGVGT